MLRRLLPLALALAAASPLHAGALAPCLAEPFGELPAGERTRGWVRPCGGERTQVLFAPPPPRPLGLRLPPTRTTLDSLRTGQIAPGVSATLRLQWTAIDDHEEELRTERTAVAAAGTWSLDEDWALQMNVGREKTAAMRTRATLATLWRPVKTGLVFAEWAGTPEGTDEHRVGARFWLVPSRLALDYSTRLRAGSTPAEQQRIGLTWGLIR